MFDVDTAPLNVFNSGDTFLESEASFPTPDSDEFINDLDIWLLPADGATIFDAIAFSQSPDGTLEHLFFQIPTTGDYKFWVVQPDEGDEDIPGGQIYGVAWWATPANLVFVPGDYNGDQIVDAQDYNVWRGDFGDSVTAGTGADGNGDGVIDAADYVVWRKNLDAAGSGSGLASVPEPSGSLLFAIASIVLGCCSPHSWRAPLPHLRQRSTFRRLDNAQDHGFSLLR